MSDKKNDKDNYLYHGTGHDILPFIAKHGLDPEASGGLTWFHKDINESRRYSESAANQMHGAKRKGALLRVALDKVPADAAQHLSYSDITGTTQVVPPHHIEHEQPDGSWKPLKTQTEKAEGGEVDDGITAYHGSPHDFDKFDISKIGTGEGAQAYGHGLYFAESEPIAKHYRDTLSNANMKYIGNTEDVVDKLISAGVSPDHAYEMAYSAYEGGFNPNKETLSDFFKEDKHLKNYLKNKDVVDAIHDYTRTPTPTMYEVRINAHPDHFLDWDKPLEEQPYVMDKLIKAGAIKPDGSLSFMYNEAPSRGGEMYERLTSPMAEKLTGGKSQKHASDFLHGIGIKGIKYFDAGSRGAGEGSRNYVVFDDKLVSTKRKYARGGIVNA